MPITNKKGKQSTKQIKSSENLIKHTELFIEKDGFMVITDSNGKILTDMTLLSILRSLRYKIAKESGIPAYKIAYNKDLVRLATDKPITTEEFLAIQGIGLQKYEAYGKVFIDTIKRYMNNQKIF